MKTLAETATERSRLFQTIALGFNHPVKPFHRVLVDGSYWHTLAQLRSAVLDCSTQLPTERSSFTDFEADYIHLFQMGRGGKPIVALNAGDHKAICRDQGRPEFLLQYSAWYKHFGLKINDAEDANELPDHIVCQLEFMAWLAHLEAAAGSDPELQQGYQLAQRDFLQRHLTPFLEVLVSALQPHNGSPALNAFYLALAALALSAADALEKQLDTLLIATSQPVNANNPEQIAAVNLWG